MNAIGPTYKKIAAIGLLALAIILIIQFLVVPIWNTFDGRNDEINELELRVERLESLKMRLSQTSPLLDSEVRKGLGKGIFLHAESDDLASANLQSRLRTIVTASGATMRSVRSLIQPEIEDGPKPIGLTLSIIGDLESTQLTLHRIETAVPHLFIENMRIQPSRRQGDRALLNLDIELDLVAYRLEESL